MDWVNSSEEHVDGHAGDFIEINGYIAYFDKKINGGKGEYLIRFTLTVLSEGLVFSNHGGLNTRDENVFGDRKSFAKKSDAVKYVKSVISTFRLLDNLGNKV